MKVARHDPYNESNKLPWPSDTKNTCRAVPAYPVASHSLLHLTQILLQYMTASQAQHWYSDGVVPEQ